MALSTLGKDRRIAESDKLASFPEHPDTFFPSFFGYFAGVVHVCKNYRCILSQIVGGAGVMWHLGNRDISEDTILSHFFNEGVGAGDILLVVGGADMSKLSPYPVAGGDDGADLEMLQEDVLELNHLFVGDVACHGEVEVPVAFLVALLIELGNPPAANQNDGMLCELFDFCASHQDEEGGGKGSNGFLFPLVFRTAPSNYGYNGLIWGSSICGASLRAPLGGTVLSLSDLRCFAADLLAPCHSSIVEVDYTSTVVWLQLDLDPFRCFGLCGRGRHRLLRRSLGEVGIVTVTVQLESLP
jgi:hypothetical protein